MANLCTTDVFFKTSKEYIKDLKERLDYLSSLSEPLVPNGYGRLWLGCLIQTLYGNFEEIPCRGEITDYSIEEKGIKFTIVSAWNPPFEFFLFLEQSFPESKLYYIAEEPGFEIYETNDAKGEVFSSSYKIDGLINNKEIYEYFDSEEDLIDYARRNLDSNIENYADLDSYAEKINSADSDDFLIIAEFEYYDYHNDYSI